MIENLRKIIKRNFKKQGRNITTGTVVAFLLSCSTVMATEYGTQIEFIGNDNNIKVNVNGGEGLLEGDKWEPLTYTQNGTISKSVKFDGENITVDGNSASGTIEGVYGLKLTNSSNKTINFIQNGTIAVSYTETNIEDDALSEKKGNGFEIAGDGITVNVNGNIKGEIELHGADDVGQNSKVEYVFVDADAFASANGIYTTNSTNTIENITGSINGLAILAGGNDITAEADAYAYVGITASANGIYIESSQSTIGNITGNINGFAILTGGNNTSADNYAYTFADAEASANGIYMESSESTTIRNITGSINGFAILQRGSGSSSQGDVDISIKANASANGIYFNNSTDINNSGKIQGYAGFYNNNGTTATIGDEKEDSLSFSGNGIAFAEFDDVYSTTGIEYKNTFNNKGIITGSESAVALGSIGDGGAINNYGIMAGKEILGDGANNPSSVDSLTNNCGVTITNGVVEINSAYQVKDGKEITINTEPYHIWNVNGETASITLTDETYNNYIFNGVDKTIAVSGAGTSHTLTNSVVNGFKTAVAMQGNGGNGDPATLNIENTVINGGADISYKYADGEVTELKSSPALLFTGNSNNFTASGLSVINGDIQIASGDSFGKNKITLSDKTILNGDIRIEGSSVDNNISLSQDTILNGDIIGNGSDKSNSVSLGRDSSSSDSTMNIFASISGIKNLNIDGSVTFFEQAKDNDGNRLNGAELKDIENIDISTGGDMRVRLGVKEDDKVTNHVLNNIGATVKLNDDGKITFVLNGNGDSTYISLGGTTLDGAVGGEDESSNLKTNSLVHYIEKKADTGDALVIKVREDIGGGDGDEDFTGFPDYYYLNKIYKSIINSSQDSVFEDTTEYGEMLKMLSDTFASSPYSFSSEVSRKTMKMFKNTALSQDLNPDLHKWAVMGGALHNDGGSTDTFYGKGVTEFDTGSRDIKADTTITGGYLQGEYKVNDTLTAGVIAGGSSSNTDIEFNKLEGDSFYLGSYIKKQKGNLKLTGGTGFYYGNYEADRTTKLYWSQKSYSYSQDYNNVGFNIYGEARYSNQVGDNLFLEPNIALEYTFVTQEGVDEGNEMVAIETDDKDFNYTTLKTGVDLKKVIPTEKAKHTLTAGISYERFLDGDDEEYITGRMKDGTDFDILVAHKNKHQISLNAKYEIEREDGILFNLKGEYSFERDSHNNGAKNKTDGEWTVGVGIGYKF